MTYEKVKSIILTVLVAVSAILTWSLWTFQPNYDKLENQETNVSLSPDKTETSKIVLPHQVIFQIDNSHYGTASEEDLISIMDEVGKWNFNEPQEVEWGSLDIQPNMETVHILYQDIITSDLFKSMYPNKQENFPNFPFDKMIIKMPSERELNGVVYFVSQSNETIYKCTISLSNAQSFHNKFFYEARNYHTYFSFQTGSGKIVYLPQNEVKLNSYQYRTEQIDTVNLKNALFRDPGLVQRESTSRRDEYRNGEYLMAEDKDKHTIKYVKLGDSDSERINSLNLLQSSINFVNQHGGWTNSYRFVEFNDENDNRTTIRFRMYMPEGYPIISKGSMSELRIVWRKEDINLYTRNNFFLTGPPFNSEKEPPLVSGYQALEYIKLQEDDYRDTLLQDITIGYEMKFIEDNEYVIELKPSWFYKYNNSDWKTLKMDELGGEKSGLE